MKEKLETLIQNSIIGAHWGAVALMCIFSGPAHLFHLLTASFASMADWLARKRYGIKGEGADYFSMSSREIPAAVFDIKDPVLTSHKRMSQSQEEEAPHNPGTYEEVGESAVEDSSFDSSEESPVEGEEEPTERSIDG